MHNPTKLVMLGLLLVPFAAIINGNAYAETVNVTITPGSGVPGCEVDNNCFDPATVTVPVGTTVVWKNGDSQGHTITSGNAGDEQFGTDFDSSFPLLKPEATFEHTFDEEGEFPYFCQVHPYMVGKVIVTEEMEETPEPTPPPLPANAISLKTDNGSVDIHVTIDKGMVHGSEFMVDPPQSVKFLINFFDPTTGQPIQHVNYQFHVADASGAMIAHEMSQHTHEGADSKSVALSNTGSFTIMIVVEGTGINKPYDTAHSGTASAMITVTPEFPLSIMAVMAAVVGIGVVATRFKSVLKP